MKNIILKNRSQSNVTLLANEFIDQHMVQANGELVKVYIFLLRHMDDAHTKLSISTIADALNNTESDIIRAFNYWEKEGLLCLDKDEGDNIIALDFRKKHCTGGNCHKSFSSPTVTQNNPVIPSSLEDSPPKAIPFDAYKAARDTESAEKEKKTILHIAECYLGKTLSPPEIDTLCYFYDELGMDADLIEYLIGSCVDNGHKSLQYIKKVAFSWNEKGIQTVDTAIAEALKYSKSTTAVMRAFGISGRSLNPQEIEHIKKWTVEYGLSLEIVVEACNRTIAKTSQASFQYADSILNGWHKSNVAALEDILVLDEKFREEQEKKKTAKKSKSPTLKTADDFEQRNYDWDALENRLLSNTKKKHKVI